ncbi:MAG TPA: ParB/RepB/Spo0J family partition protein [Actinomycetota bacterium]
MSETPGGLGRGLSALLPEQRAAGPRLSEIAVAEIRPNPRQPRARFEDEALEELASSIRSVGVLQPVIVRRSDAGFELIAGERRVRAARRAGLTQIPAVIRDAEDDAMLLDALVENIQRVELNPLEEAAAYRQLVDDLSVTHEEIARRVGKSRAAVTNALRLLNLAPSVQQRIVSGALSAAHGRALAAIADPDAQERAAVRIVAEGMNVRQTEELVGRMAAQGEVSERAKATRVRATATPAAGILEAEMLLSDILATRVRVEGGRGRGRVVIEYADFDDLDRIVRIIEGERAD